MTPDCCPTRTAADRVADAVWSHVLAARLVSQTHIQCNRLPHGWSVSAMLLDMLAHIDGGHVDEHFVAWANGWLDEVRVSVDDHPSLTAEERTPVDGLNTESDA